MTTSAHVDIACWLSDPAYSNFRLEGPCACHNRSLSSLHVLASAMRRMAGLSLPFKYAPSNLAFPLHFRPSVIVLEAPELHEAVCSSSGIACTLYEPKKFRSGDGHAGTFRANIFGRMPGIQSPTATAIKAF